MDLNETTKILNKELQIENDVLMQNIEKKNISIKELENKNADLISNIDTLTKNYKDLQEEYKILQNEYNKIIYSRSYKIIQKVKRIIKRG